MNEELLGHVVGVVDYYLDRHFDGRDIATIEIGCGFATERFLARSRSYLGYVDRSDVEGLGRQAAYRNSAIARGRAHFLPGCEDQFLSAAARSSIDILMIGGKYRFPLWQSLLEKFVPQLRDGAVVILSSIEIPSVFQLYKILNEDARFNLHLTISNFAFFGYARPTNNSEIWNPQSFDFRNGPSFDPFAYSPAYVLPLRLDFSGWFSDLPRELVRGFRIAEGRPVTDGNYSRIELSVDARGQPEVELSLALRPAQVAGGGASQVHIASNGMVSPKRALEAEKQIQIDLTVPISADGKVSIEVYSDGLSSVQAVRDWQIEPSTYTPGVEILSVEFRGANGGSQASVVRRHRGQIVSFSHRQNEFRFFIENPHDSIQAHHYSGAFYEVEELELIARYVRNGDSILDVGANIGNHCVYFEKVLGAKKVTPIELQPEAIRLLKINASLNNLASLDTSFLGVGLGDHSYRAHMHIPQSFNPAGATFRESAHGHFEIVAGDDLLKGCAFDFVKVDVEGMECAVLRGMSNLLQKHKPLLFVEVWEENRAEFDSLMRANRYEVLDEYRRYSVATNFLLGSIA